MSALYDLIQGEADVGDESDDESFDEVTGDPKRNQNGANGANGRLDDSSEEEDDDDDEEAARAVSDMPGEHYLTSRPLLIILGFTIGTRGIHRGRRRRT